MVGIVRADYSIYIDVWALAIVTGVNNIWYMHVDVIAMQFYIQRFTVYSQI